MARDAIAVTSMSPNTNHNNPAGTAIVPANGALIPNVRDGSRILLRITNTSGAIRTVTIPAGINPPSPRAGLGDFTFSLAATTGDSVLVLESARFKQDADAIYINFEAGHTGIVSAVRLPKGA